MSKYTLAERHEVRSIVANLSIKRIPDVEIMKEVFRQTGKTLSRSGLFYDRQQIKKESYYWYQRLREGHFEYIHEFKTRIREIEDLMKRHYKIIDDNPDNPTIQQTSLAELHRLNITMSNYFDVAPSIVGYNTTPNSTTTMDEIIRNSNRNANSISIPQKDIIV